MKYLIHYAKNAESFTLSLEYPDSIVRLQCIAKVELTEEEFRIANYPLIRALLSEVFYSRQRKEIIPDYSLQEESDNQIISTYFSPIITTLAEKFREAADKHESQSDGYANE